MTIKADILLDSISPRGHRLTTFVLYYHRFIHSELMTHRVFSRNASSSRAIPVKTLIGKAVEDPAIPVKWAAEQKGMQGGDEIDEPGTAESIWLKARDSAIHFAERLSNLGIHKSIANRIVEPWHHIAVVLTGTDFENFFTLRAHPDAQPEFQVLAQKMAEAYRKSEPQFLNYGEWHLPFLKPDERRLTNLQEGIKCSVARCARVSFLNHDGSNPNIQKDIELHDRLVVQRPAHASPAEHQATPLRESDENKSTASNFKGWLQYRKMIKNETATTFPWENLHETEIQTEITENSELDKEPAQEGH